MTPAWLQGTGPTLWMEWFFAYAILHAVADYSLQTDFMARGKNRHAPFTSECSLPAKTLWIYCLTSHALVHAGGVWLVSGRVGFALAEFVLHWLIDWAKIERKMDFHTDQALHLACKAAYVAVAVAA